MKRVAGSHWFPSKDMSKSLLVVRVKGWREGSELCHGALVLGRSFHLLAWARDLPAPQHQSKKKKDKYVLLPSWGPWRQPRQLGGSIFVTRSATEKKTIKSTKEETPWQSSGWESAFQCWGMLGSIPHQGTRIPRAHQSTKFPLGNCWARAQHNWDSRQPSK